MTTWRTWASTIGGVIGTAVVAYLIIVELLGQGYNTKNLALVGAYAFAVIGLALALGVMHLFSLAHAFFFGAGAYVYAILAGDTGWPTWAAAMVAVAFSGVIALVAGRVLLRLEGFYFAVATLGMTLIGENILFVLRDVTGGDDGLSAPALSAFGYQVDTPTRSYVLVTVALAIGLAVGLNVRRSPRGRAARAVATDELMAASNGINVVRAKSDMFVLSAVYGSLGGVLYASSTGFVFPSIANISTTLEFVVAVIAGGSGSIVGAVIVISVLHWLPIAFEIVEDYLEMVYGAVLVVVIVGTSRLGNGQRFPGTLSRIRVRPARNRPQTEPRSDAGPALRHQKASSR